MRIGPGDSTELRALQAIVDANGGSVKAAKALGCSYSSVRNSLEEGRVKPSVRAAMAATGTK
jgi:molybdenum-dependent DNA-binding transcriptional regulator ModE